MKDSGVEWIGEIPKEWETRRLKVALAREKELVDKYSGEDILSLTKGGVVVRDLVNPKGKMPTTFDGYQSISKGNIVTCLFDIDVTPRCVGIANNDGLTSPAYTQYKVINKFEMDFIYYYLLMLDNDKVLVPITKSLRNTIKSEDFLNLEFSFPDNISQKKISTHLTASILKINQLTDETQQSIEELKKYKQSLITEAVTKGLDKNVEIKDSGFNESIKLPKNWDINKVRNVFRMNKGLTITKENLQSEGISVISYGEIHSKYGFRFDPDKHEVKKVAESYMDLNESALLQQGDFVFADTSEDIEGSGNFTCYIGSQTCFAGYHTIILKPIQKMNFNFLAYLFESVAFRAQIQKKVQGIKVYSITQRILKPLTIWLPPAIEQQRIVEYLDEKVGKIDTLISKKQKVTQELKIYKKSLIYEYVTGKKEV